MIVDYHIAKSAELFPMTRCMYQYIVGANGVFVRAQREGLAATIRVVSTERQAIRGLTTINEELQLGRSKVPQQIVEHILTKSYYAGGYERLFYLTAGNWGSWKLAMPRQVATPVSVRPADMFCPDGEQALIEVHSHHHMAPFFSGADDKDEQGFRIYAVIGNLHERPEILARVGIYGHFRTIPAEWVFQVPPYLTDLATIIEAQDDNSNDPIE